MAELVGQQKLKDTLSSYNINTVPRTLMLLGDEGCGKRSFATFLANHLGLMIINVGPDVSDTDIIEYQLSPINRLYVIDLRLFTDKQQNKLLKFIEEPTETCFIVLLANSEFGVLDTILNRCIRLHFAQYTFAEMKQIAVFHSNYNEQTYAVCNTPGQLAELDDTTIANTQKLCRSLIASLTDQHYGRTLSVYTKINYAEEYDLINFNVFFNMMISEALELYKTSNSERYLKVYSLTQSYLRNLNLAPKANKSDFMISYLSEFFKEVISNDTSRA